MKFEDVLPAMREGKKIRRKGGEIENLSLECFLPEDLLEFEHIMAEDWEIKE